MKLIQKTLQFGAFVLLATCSSSRKFQTNESPLDSKEKNNIQNNVYAGQDAQLSEEQYEVLSNAVFELVLPRKEDTFVEYEEKLPEHLLPYKLRKSPYRGIGTAFVVASPKGHRFVSAAHVFDLHELTLAGPVALRDADGKIYEIDQILKYSQHRDLIEFTLKKAPKNMKPLQVAKQSRMGQFVFTAGNALGDGIVTRSGNITSFTPEPINGDWNDIRYSAPASPGNSGGPLLNKSLEVVGVVVRRTESENLNFAIPLKELDAVKSAEFFRRDVKIEKFKKQLGKDWNFSTNTPATMNEITQKAHSDFLKFYLALQGEFQKKYANDIFPSDPKVKDWARDSLSYTLAGVIQKDNADRWVTAPVEWTLHKLETNRTLAIEKNAEGGSVAFMLERPKNKKLKDFISDPKGILDAFMKQVRWNRPYAGRQIPVKSYGKPKYANKWTDIYGRNWRDYEWVTSFDDRSLQMNCLHMPAGVFCMFDYVPYRLSELNRALTRSDTGRVLTEFYGKLSDWKEWKTLPAEWQQELIPSNVQVQSSANRYTWNAGSYSGKIMKTDFDDDSEMTLTYSSMPNDIKKLRLRHVSFAEKNGDIQVGIGINQRPTENGHPSYREVWDKMIARKAPYNGQAQMQGKHSLIVSVLSELKTKTKSVRSLTKEAIPEQLLFSTCGVINSEGEATIKRICQDFSNDTIMRE